MSIVLGRLFLDDRDALEAAWRASPPSSADAFTEGDRLLEGWIARVEAAGAVDRRPRHVRRYWRRRDRRAGR